MGRPATPGTSRSRAGSETAGPLAAVVEDVLEAGRDEIIPIRHLNFRKTRGVDDILFFDDAVPEEQKRRERVNLVVGEFLFRRHRTVIEIGRHGAVDEVPDLGRKRPVASNGFLRLPRGKRALSSGQARAGAPFEVLPVARSALLPVECGTVFGGPLPGGSSLPSGPIEMSQACTSAGVAAFPMP